MATIDQHLSDYIRVNGELVFFAVPCGGTTIHTDDSSSEQCEGCGLDIMDTGTFKVATGEVVCVNCNSRYQVRQTYRT